MSRSSGTSWLACAAMLLMCGASGAWGQTLMQVRGLDASVSFEGAFPIGLLTVRQVTPQPFDLVFDEAPPFFIVDLLNLSAVSIASIQIELGSLTGDAWVPAGPAAAFTHLAAVPVTGDPNTYPAPGIARIDVLKGYSAAGLAPGDALTIDSFLSTAPSGDPFVVRWTFHAVPEPSTLLILSGLSLGLCRRSRVV